MAARQKKVQKEDRKVSSNSAKTSKRGGSAPQAGSSIMREVSGLVTAAGSVLLLVFVFFENAGGVIGGAIRGVLVGMLGFGAFAIPFMLLAFAVMWLTSGKPLPAAKQVMTVLLFLCVITFLAVPSVNLHHNFTGLFDYLRYYYSIGGGGNGGLVGAAIATLILTALGTFGSYLLLVTLGVILAIFLTGKSLFAFVAAMNDRYGSRARYEDYEDDEEDGMYIPEELAGSERKSGKKFSLLSARKRKKHGKPQFFTIEDNEDYDDEYDDDCVDLISESCPQHSTKEQVIEVIRDGETGDIVDIKDKEDETVELVGEAAVALEPELDGDIVINENTNKFVDITGGQPDPETIESQLDEGALGAEDEEEYVFPPITLLTANPNTQVSGSRSSILENSRKLEETLKSFGVEAKVVEVSKGPTVTRYELAPGVGVKVSKISSLADDLALNLAAVGIRIEAPIPGKAAVGIEIPNKEISPVYLREVIEDEAFASFPSKVAFALGKDIAGNTVVADIAKMPHLLIAGATGSGKSVCINTLITSIIYKATPQEVKLLMIDPKVVELSIYNGIPHLLIPVVTDPKKASAALFWAVQEMVRRYNLFAEASVRDLKGYNAMLSEKQPEEGEEVEGPLPQIVIIIDELADLMMVAPGEVEDSICRLAQMARAAGLHLIIATQRPSVDVITGLIKANVPSRLAFAVSSGVDSRTILDSVGAERLLGKGDMLFNPVGLGKPQRIQGAFISDKEVESIVSFVKRGEKVTYDNEMIEKITAARPSSDAADGNGGEIDELFDAAAEFVISKEKASASLLQRQFRIGYNRASRLIEDLETKGIVGPEDGAKPRKVLMNAYQWQEWREGRAD